MLHHVASYKIWDVKSSDLECSISISILYIYYTLKEKALCKTLKSLRTFHLASASLKSDSRKKISCFLLRSSCFYSSQMEPELTHLYFTLKSNQAVFTQTKIPLKIVYTFFLPPECILTGQKASQKNLATL